MATRTKRRRAAPPPPDERPARVRHLVVLEATLLLARVELRQDEMVRLFSRLRDRSPLMAATHSTLPSIGFESLSALPPVEQRAALAFIELSASLRWYLQYTEDMPGTLRTTLERLVAGMREGLTALIATLGPLDAGGAPVVEGQARRKAGNRGLTSPRAP